MPNCDFYAAGEDHRLIVEFILAQTSCRIFELSSAPGKRLRELKSYEEMVACRSGLFNLWPVAACAKVRIVRNKATKREELEGWGTIHLYWGRRRAGGLGKSHTNHNSAKRAATWQATYKNIPSVASWDFSAVTRESGMINRAIRKLAVAKLDSRVVLPEARRLFKAGIKPQPF
jgi:hypothetical protein